MDIRNADHTLYNPSSTPGRFSKLKRLALATLFLTMAIGIVVTLSTVYQRAKQDPNQEPQKITTMSDVNPGPDIGIGNIFEGYYSEQSSKAAPLFSKPISNDNIPSNDGPSSGDTTIISGAGGGDPSPNAANGKTVGNVLATSHTDLKTMGENIRYHRYVI